MKAFTFKVVGNIELKYWIPAYANQNTAIFVYFSCMLLHFKYCLLIRKFPI